MDSQIVQKIQELANSLGAQANFEGSNDNTYIDASVQKDGRKIFINLLRVDDNFFAFGLDIDIPGFPPEIYPDNLKENFSYEQRSIEILENTKNVLTGKITFHPKPGLFNKSKGYIMLPIDGVSTKIKLNRNGLA